MGNTQAKSLGKYQGLQSPKTSGSHVTTDNLVDFVQVRAIRMPVKELQRITGLSKKQCENLRQGISGISGKTLTNWCINDPCFAGEYAEYVGLILPGSAEAAGAMTRAYNALARTLPP